MISTIINFKHKILINNICLIASSIFKGKLVLWQNISVNQMNEPKHKIKDEIDCTLIYHRDTINEYFLGEGFKQIDKKI